MVEFIVIFLLIVNILAFLCIRSNKKHGRFSKYKIDKGTIFLLSIFGGSIGVMIGMRYYNYLRDRFLFKVGVPILLILQLILLLMYWRQ